MRMTSGETTDRGRGVRPAARRMRPVALVVLALGLVAVLSAASCGAPNQASGAASTTSSPTELTEPPAVYEGPAGADRPNIVFVLMDDADLTLLKTMRSGRYMKRHGATYENAFVVDSLCCPSRAATLTGQYPHQNGVLTNVPNEPNDLGPLGGWKAFVEHGSEQRTFALRLQQSGYTTGLVGKYLNGLGAGIQGKPTGTPIANVPPGWSEFRAVMGSAYDEWKYEAAEPDGNGGYQVRAYGAPKNATRAERDRLYAGNVIKDLSLQFIEDHQADEAPYFLYVGTYAPHYRINDNTAYDDEPLFPAAYRDRPSKKHPHGNCGAVDCRQLTIADIPGYGDKRGDNQPYRANGTLAPAWNTAPQGLPKKEAVTDLRDRARMVQTIDRMVTRILSVVDDNTYVVLTSDNGLHLGQYGLTAGKGTPYEADIKVPLVMVGPGVVPGPRKTVVANIDWAPTFEDLADVSIPDYRSGRSMVPTFANPQAHVQAYTFIEHTFSRSKPGQDPDRPYSNGGLNVIPSYLAVRSRNAMLARFDLDRSWDGVNYAYEFYDLRTQPHELVNQFAKPAYAKQVATLMAKLKQFDACKSIREGDALTDACRRLTSK
jgi:arylsulfatase A-like enzyme